MNNLSRFAGSLNSWVNSALALVYPELCQLCAESRATANEGYVCAGCAAKAKFVSRPWCERCGRPFEGQISIAFECANCREADLHFESARSAVLAQDEVLEIIHRYKYKRALWFEPRLGDWLVQKAKPELEAGNWDWIVPVPLHPTKEREREFNQAERLAGWLAEATGIPVNTRLVRRVQPTRTQTQLSREERTENVRKAFAPRADSRLEGERIVLLDDVFTTGATTNACARVLKEAGAGRVCVWTVARGI